ncbi:MAG: RlmE family RNA methyltransferase [Gammaproteobacteria bacterium]|nr:MAG: RlmE family RNA methyltransferase [Gammaproteobacteria bacterium]
MTKRSGTRQWFKRHTNDPFVRQARKAGYRSRAAYKLIEMDQRYRIFRKGQVVIDLGGAPGGWSQVATEKVGKTGQVIAIDLLPMQPMEGVSIRQGDIADPSIHDWIERELKKPCGVVISDMAPNITGIRDRDQANAVRLWQMALQFALQYLGKDGAFIIKVFQGDGFEPFLNQLREAFKSVTVHKPKASRTASREVYFMAKNPKFRPNMVKKSDF